MLEILGKICSFIWQIWSSLTQEQKDRIFQVFTDFMDDIFREFFRRNGGAAR